VKQLLLPGDIPTKTEAMDPLAFFDAIYERYKQAEAACGGAVDRYYCVAGFTVRLRLAGTTLLPYMTRALAHLATEPCTEPALTVCLWDSDSTNIVMPPPPWQGDDYREGGEIRGFIDDRIHTIFQIGANALSLLDRQRNLGIYWVKTATEIPYYERSAPLRAIFHLWMSQRGIQLIHAGAVGLPSGGVLLVGKGGAGKSTTALACLNSALFYASDDYCLLAPEPTPTVFSLYSSGKKNADDVGRLPFLQVHISNPDRLATEKAVYFLHDNFSDKLLPSFPLKAILIPRLGGKPEKILQPASSATGLAALAPSTIFQLPGAGKAAFQAMAKIVRQVNCYYLNLGSDMAQISEVILKLLYNNKTFRS
jgi:hypothetical protein